MKNKFRLLLLGLGLFSASNKALAITATVTNTFSAGQKIVASQMNTNFNDILSAINGQLAGDNILTGGILTANIADLGVTTAKLATSSVTNAKLATLNFASSTAVNYINTGITATPITSKTITTIGRPISVKMVNSQGFACNSTGLLAGNSFATKLSLTGSGSEAAVELRKNGATVTITELANSGGTQRRTCSQLLDYVDTSPGTGSISYEVRGYADAGQDIVICNCALYIQEL